MIEKINFYMDSMPKSLMLGIVVTHKRCYT